jgi:hypothetical protein
MARGIRRNPGPVRLLISLAAAVADLRAGGEIL